MNWFYKLIKRAPPWMMAAVGVTLFAVCIMTIIWALFTGEWRWLIVSAICFFIISGKD